jgi:hypothetical protein
VLLLGDDHDLDGAAGVSGEQGVDEAVRGRASADHDDAAARGRRSRHAASLGIRRFIEMTLM